MDIDWYVFKQSFFGGRDGSAPTERRCFGVAQVLLRLSSYGARAVYRKGVCFDIGIYFYGLSAINLIQMGLGQGSIPVGFTMQKPCDKESVYGFVG